MRVRRGSRSGTQTIAVDVAAVDKGFRLTYARHSIDIGESYYTSILYLTICVAVFSTCAFKQVLIERFEYFFVANGSLCEVSP